MSPAILLHSLTSSGFFGSRAFTPAFLTALLLRFGHRLPFLSASEFLQNAGSSPSWFTHGGVITVLGVLSLLEILATKDPDAEELLQQVDKYLKMAMAVVSTLGIMTVADQRFIEETLSGVQSAGLGQAAVPILVGGLAFAMAFLRGSLLDEWIEIDEDDDLGVRQLFSWCEDLWVVCGMVILVLFPLVMLILLAAVLGLLFALRAYLVMKEEKARIPCDSCGERIYPCALACHSCGHAVEAPRAVGLLGQAKERLVSDRELHAMRLIARKRCPVCATYLKQRLPTVTCPACGHRLFAEQAECRRYVDAVSGSAPRVIGLCAGLSLIPVIGLIPGVIYYRLTIVAPYRRYLPGGRRFCLKWVMRLFFFILIALQWIPAVGGVVVPLMALTSHWLNRASFKAMTEQPTAGQPVPAVEETQ